jgi:hypothetical protein
MWPPGPRPGEEVGVAVAGGDSEVAVGGLVDGTVDGGDPAADVDEVAATVRLGSAYRLAL